VCDFLTAVLMKT